MSDTQRIYSFISLLLILFTTPIFCSSKAHALAWIPNEATLLADANSGFALEQGEMGRRCEQGKDPCTPQNYQEAAKWYRLAADQGLPSAQIGLGYLYFRGLGVEQNYEEAYFWLELGNRRVGYTGGPRKNALDNAKTSLSAAQLEKVNNRLNSFTPQPSEGVLAVRARIKLRRTCILIGQVIAPIIILGSAWLLCHKFKPRKAVKIISYSAGIVLSFLIFAVLDIIRINI
jgi:hypothetical protein